MSDEIREYVLTEEEYVYLFFALGQPELGDQHLKRTRPGMKWKSREKFLDLGKNLLFLGGLVKEDDKGSLTVDPNLKTVFEYGMPVDKLLYLVMNTPYGPQGANVYIRENGKWMVNFTYMRGNHMHNRLIAGEPGEIPELILEAAKLSKPAVPVYSAVTFFQDTKTALKTVRLIEMDHPWPKVKFPLATAGVIHRADVEDDKLLKIDPYIAFLEGKKYSWFLRINKGEVEILPGGVDRLKEEIAKLVG